MRRPNVFKYKPLIPLAFYFASHTGFDLLPQGATMLL